MDLGVRDRGYLIVGGTSGMGLATAHVLAEDGARLAVVGRDLERAEKAAAALRADHGVHAVAIAGDVARDDAEARRVVDEAVGSLGGLAGIAVTTGTARESHQPLEAASDADWTVAFEDTLMGTVRPVRAALRHLAAGGGGTVVTTAAYSIRSPHGRTPYSALKGAVAVFTKDVAKEYGRQGIRANCVCPGAIETEGLAQLRRQLADERGWALDEALERIMVEEWKLSLALARPGQPREVGELMAFLLSPRAGYLTGALVNIDGGTDF